MKYILTFCLCFASIFMSAQNLSPLKVFINPGHGGHDPNDRNIVIYPFKQGDPNGFWESNSNLDKGLFLRDYLEKYGATVYMSRVTNTSADDLDLSVISGMANENNVDVFFSIHSNAHNAQTNYPLVLFKGYDDNPERPEDKEMAKIHWTNLHDRGIAPWTYNTLNIRGDLSFYGYHLGVLKNLNVKGFLSEGTFHDYIPETYRLMSPMYKKLEAWTFLKTVFDYFEKGQTPTGNIAGDIRDSRNKITDSYYCYPGHDNYLPINKAKVTLLPNGTTIETDTLYNGVYLFDELTPGTYQVKVEAEGYYPATETIEVSAHKTTYFNFGLNKVRNTPPKVVSYSPKMESATDSVECSTKIVMEFNWDMDETSLINAFSITPAVEGDITFEDSQHRMVFTPKKVLDKATVYTVKIDKSAKHPDNISMEEDFTFQFITKNRNVLALLLAYPNNGDNTVYNDVEFQLVFDAKVSSNMDKSVHVFDSEGNELTKHSRNQKTNSVTAPYGSYYFKLVKNLTENQNYKIVLDQSISDIYNIPLEAPIEINFTVNNQKITDQSVIENFEGTNTFAYDADNSINVTSASTARSSAQKLFDSYSYSYKYSFSDQPAEAMFKVSATNVAVSYNQVLGAHIYGDFSGNDLYAVLVDDAGINHDVMLKKLDFFLDGNMQKQFFHYQAPIPTNSQDLR
ncbi:MAG: N-acetylmuramoyl-L-alanine amidase [Dysgonomonas sp.]